MLKWFLHPETNEKLLVNDCLEKGLLSEYYPLAYLKICAQQREWKGTASTTQLLKGLREAYLQVVSDYASRPDDQTFRIIGTIGHGKLEELTPKESMTEIKLDNEISGVADLIEKQPNGAWWLVDYKTGGAYSVAKALGMVKKKRPMIDEEGNPVLYKRSGYGYKAGDQKLENYFEIDLERADKKGWILQLNKYRKEIESIYNIKIAALKIFAMPRDGGTVTAKGYGITKKTYFIDVPIIDNKEVDAFFNPRQKDLILAINAYLESKNDKTDKRDDITKISMYCPKECTPEEAWYDKKTGLYKKCKFYCSVSGICQKIGCSYLKEIVGGIL